MVDPVDQTGHGGGFTASGRTGNKDHATGIFGDVHHILGNGSSAGSGSRKAITRITAARGTTLLVGIDTKSGNTGNGKRKVIITGFHKTGYIAVFRKAVNGAE